MAQVLPRLGVEASIPVPSRIGLLSVATSPPGASDERWAGGIEYRPEQAVATNFTAALGCPPAALPAATEGPLKVSWDPYVLVHSDKCDVPIPNWIPEVKRRATQALDRFSGFYLERVLWTNQVAGADYGATHPNVSLADTPGVGPSIDLPNGSNQIGVVPGWGFMLKRLSELLGGTRGLIHVTARTLGFLLFYALVERDGETIRAVGADHLVAVGSGYTGSGPDGTITPGAQWIYGTSPVQVRLGAITVPVMNETGLNRTANTIEFKAQRAALASWDRTAHIGLLLCLEDPGPACVVGS